MTRKIPVEEEVRKPERLQKVLSRLGVCSRRKAEEYIRLGKVKLNGSVVNEQGTKVDPTSDLIEVNGERVAPTAEADRTYILLYKPRGYICSLNDDRGRPVVIDLLEGVTERVFPVGRLDMDTEGVLILTNDGEFANTVLHPRGGILRTYHAKLKGDVRQPVLERLIAGVKLEDGPAQALSVERQGFTGKHTWVEITVTEGRNREVRRMCEAIGHPVMRLRREKFGPVSLEGLYPGQQRRLGKGEVRELLSTARLVEEGRKRRRMGKRERERSRKEKGRPGKKRG